MADTVFTWGPTNVTTLITTTLEKRRKGKGIHDAVFNEMVLLSWLHDKNRTTEDGGATIVAPIMSGTNETAQFFDGHEQVDVTPQEGFTSASYAWKQAADSISVSDREEMQNSGSSQVFRIADAKMKQGEMALRNRINQAFFTSSPASNAIGSLVTSIDATSTIGDINSSSNTFWQGSVTASGSFAAQGLSDMRAKYNTIASRNPVGGPQLILTTQTVYEFYEGALQPQQRFQGKVGNGSFDNLMFKAAPVTYDVECNSGVMYFLHSDAIEFIVHSQRDFVLTEWVKPVNGVSKVAQLVLMANLVVNNRRKLGKLTAITA